MKQYMYNLCALFLVLMFSGFPVNSAAVEDVEEESVQIELSDSIWVWAEEAEEQEQHAIFFSSYDKGEWSEPVKISDNSAYNVTPSTTRAGDSDIWLVWAAHEGLRSIIKYKRFVDGEWTDEEVYDTGLSSNTAPNIGVDHDGKVWLVWTGFDGLIDDIYYSTWTEDAFDAPTVVIQSDVPDVLPVLVLDTESQSVKMRWKRFSETGYVKYQVVWDGLAWGEPELLNSTADPESTSEEKSPETVSADDAIVMSEFPGDVNSNTVIAEDESASGANNDIDLTGILGVNFKLIVGEQVDAEGEDSSLRISEDPKQMLLQLPDFIRRYESASIHIPQMDSQSIPVREMEVINFDNK